MFVLKHTKLFIVSSVSWSCKQSRYFTFLTDMFGLEESPLGTAREWERERKKSKRSTSPRTPNKPPKSNIKVDIVGQKLSEKKSNSHELTAIGVSDRFCIDIWLKADDKKAQKHWQCPFWVNHLSWQVQTNAPPKLTANNNTTTTIINNKQTAYIEWTRERYLERGRQGRQNTNKSVIQDFGRNVTTKTQSQ